MRLAWVGNSYVYFNDLPSMLAAMLVAAGVPEEATEHGQITPGGQRFAGHAADVRVAELLSKPWDGVVLQDNSGVPGGADVSALAASREALTASLVPRVSSATRLILYGTWGHLHGSVYSAQREAYPDYTTMQRKTTAGYEAYRALVAPARCVELAPVGDAFQVIHDEERAAGRDPTAPGSLFARLFVPDNFHPSRLGSFLAACVFTHVLLAGMHVCARVCTQVHA